MRRTRAGQSPFAPDRKHLHHRLLDIGHSQRKSVLIMYLWAAAFSGSVVYLSIAKTEVKSNHHGTPVFVLVAITAAALAVLLLLSMPRLRWWEGRRSRKAVTAAAFEGAPGAGRDDHTLDGPIAVRGAEIGDTVEIRIRAIDLWLPIAGMSFRANRGSLPEDFPYSRDKVLFFDPASKVIEFAPGVVVPAKPFWGVIGVAPPPSMGRVPSGPPNVFGGNMDNHDLQPGTSLFLPVHAPGALISIGDGHAVQGDGEVGISAVETSLKGEIQVVLHKGMHTGWPRAETPTHYMTMGCTRTSTRPPRSPPAKCSISSSPPRACRATMC